MLLIGPTVKYNGPTFYNTHDNVSFNKYFFFHFGNQKIVVVELIEEKAYEKQQTTV